MRAWVPILVALVFLAGCFGGAPRGEPMAEPSADGYPRGVHPYPAGDEWPVDLEGPFDLARIEGARPASHDGIDLQGWVLHPDVPEGVRYPVVLFSTPYFAPGWEPASEDPGGGVTLPTEELLARGIALAAFSVRGTGDSGGCFSNKGLDEQRDQAALVEWLAAQPWSNGRVGMGGLSYHGTTPLMAAVQAPPALKAIYVMGPVTDPYTELHTPQGAMYTGGGTGDTFRRGSYGAATLGPESLDDPTTGLSIQAERVCPDYLEVLTVAERGHFTDDRNPAFWDERRLITRFPEITAAVYVSHGLAERDHPIQEDPVWEALTQAPKRMQLGQWGHQVPPVDSWAHDVVEWFQFWLQGVGDAPPGIGVVDYESAGGEWIRTSSWPPAEARDEVLYLDGADLAPRPGSGSRTFRSVPLPAGPESVLCPVEAPAIQAEPFGLVFESGPLPSDALLAGNPIAYVRLASDAPGGQIAVHLFAVGPEVACENGRAIGPRLLSEGVADLRFYNGNLVGEDFPTSTTVPVRIDLSNLAAEVPAGDRLVAVVSCGYPLDPEPSPFEFVSDGGRWGRSGQVFAPALFVLGDRTEASSHLVLPFVEGSLGGDAPSIAYPPRPFVPLLGSDPPIER